MLYRELEPEYFWNPMFVDPKIKRQKIENAIKTEMYGASIKKDGEYLRAIYDTDGEIWIIGRGTRAKEVHNLDKHLVFLTEWLRTNFTPGTCILGELYVPGKTSRAIRAYTGSLVPKSLANQKACPPTFYIFDIWAIDGDSLMNVTYQERMKIISALEKDFIGIKQIEWVKVVTGPQEILDFIAQAFEDGEEGCVLVRLDSIPTPGKRTAWKSMKVKKEFQDSIDCFFTGNWRPPTREYTGSELENWQYWEEIGEKNSELTTMYFAKMYDAYMQGKPIEPVTKPYALGWPGSLEVGVYKGEEIVPICYLSGLTDKMKEEFTDGQHIMRPIAITGMETTDKSIRHPKFVCFRDDISITDCTYEKIFGE